MQYRIKLKKEFRISGWIIQPGAELLCGSGNVANTLIQRGVAEDVDKPKRKKRGKSVDVGSDSGTGKPTGYDGGGEE